MGRRGRTLFWSEPQYFVTTTVVNFAKVFANPHYCDLLVSNIRHYQEKYQFEVYAYVIMPSHFHWIVRVDPAIGTISDVMRDIKKYSAWDILRQLEADGRKDLLDMFRLEALGFRDQKRKFWMKRFDDEVITTDEMMQVKVDYIHNNPVVAGLVKKPEDHLYSSARNYILGDHSILRVETNWFD
jgi:REP element-mobilizing transposase RayT